MNCKQNDAALEQKCRQTLCSPTTDNITKFKCLALKSGCNKIACIAKKFKIMDDDRSRSLSYEEFIKGCREVLRYTRGKDEEIMRDAFIEFDKNKDGTMDFDEFLFAVRPKMNDKRMHKVEEVFARMDKDDSGEITVEDMMGFYDHRQHPKYQNGEYTQKDVFLEFLKSFQTDPEEIDEKVTLDEWKDYYRGVSSSIDDDAYFCLMMDQCWNRKDAPKATKHLY